MKILWVSPFGDGWAAAARLRDLGNRVVLYNPRNRNGEGYLPTVTPADWFTFATRSDLVIVDHCDSSRPTRRNFAPSDLSLDIQQIRRRGIPVIGPVPTSELFENDPRYQRKIITRLGLGTASTEKLDKVTGVVSADPNGLLWLVFRHTITLDSGERIFAGDVVVSLGHSCKLVKTIIDPAIGFLQQINHTSYFNVEFTADAENVQVDALGASFLYPAVFHTLSDLLSGNANKEASVGLAVTLVKSDPEADDILPITPKHVGWFGTELHDESGNSRVHGPIAGAIVGRGIDWQVVHDKVYSELGPLGRPGYVYATDIGATVGDALHKLASWGWI